MVRAHALKKLEAQTTLMATLILVSIIAEWVDAWDSMQSVTVDLLGLGPPVVLAICYFLAAAVVFPHREADHERLADYYRERRPFIVAMLFVATVLDNLTYRQIYINEFGRRPAVFWLWMVPYNVAFLALLLALLFFRSPRANIILLSLAILLLTVAYWSINVADVIARYYYG
jgi:hypothetical protein